MRVNGADYRTVWLEGSVVRMIDQPRIPHEFRIADLHTPLETARAIRDMIVRGAPAIGGAGAAGMAQAVLLASGDDWRRQVREAAEALAASRPTAQDLFHAIAHVQRAIDAAPDLEAARADAVAAAQALADGSVRDCEAIGRVGAEVIPERGRVLTHCNAGRPGSGGGFRRREDPPRYSRRQRRGPHHGRRRGGPRDCWHRPRGPER